MVKLQAFLGIIGLALILFAFVDCAMREDTQLRKLPKWGWLLVIILLQVFGAVFYLVAGRNGARTPGIKKPKGKPRILPPDDDPDFLRKI
jgi:hypothetical protein